MNKTISVSYMACITFAAVGLLLPFFETKAEGYLAKVGPPPLRYQSTRAREPLNLPPLPSESASKDDASTSLPADGFSLLRRSDSALPDHLFLPPTMSLERLLGAKTADSVATASPEPLSSPASAFSPASDLLGMPQEMLVDYFKPVQTSSNAASATVLVPLEFTPPVPALSAGSSATYRAP